MQVARFPFKGNMSLVIVMPMTGHVNVSAIAAKLNISALFEHFPRERNMQVKLPKFNLEFSQDLQEVLTNMGEINLYLSIRLSKLNLTKLSKPLFLTYHIVSKTNRHLTLCRIR